jgi:hypothetical protein
MKKYICLFLIFILLIPAVAADGMIFTGEWQALILQAEKEQVGSIFYENGYENMLLSVSLDWSTAGNQSIWIFPVPADPGDVTIDMVKAHPYTRGKPLNEKYRDIAGRIGSVMELYSTFPFSFPVAYAFFTNSMDGYPDNSANQGRYHGVEGVQVYKRVEKMGLSSELITADNADALEEYLNQRGLLLPAGSKARLDEYINGKNSLIITSVKNVSEFKQFANIPHSYYSYYPDEDMLDTLSVSVRFPTERAFFPLKLTQIYGNRTIPIKIAINGWVTPQVYDKIHQQTQVSYISYDEGYIFPNQKSFFNGRKSMPSAYTKILINTSSYNFTDDLWFDPSTPVEVIYQDWAVQNPIILGILLYVPLSMLASLIAGMIVFRRGPGLKSRMLRHGLWNCATMIGFVYATSRRLILPEDQAEKKKLFVIVFLGVFLFLTYFATSIIAGYSGLLPEDIFSLLFSIPGIFQYILFSTCNCILHGISGLFGSGDSFTVMLGGWRVESSDIFPALGLITLCVSLIIFICGMDRSLNIDKKMKIFFLYLFYLLVLAGLAFLVLFCSVEMQRIIYPVIGMYALIPYGIIFGITNFAINPLLSTIAIIVNIYFYIGAAYVIAWFIRRE